MKMRLRTRLWVIVTVTAAAHLAMAGVDLAGERRVQQELAAIEQDYLPLLRLEPEVRALFDEVRRTVQDAVAAGDREAIDDARTPYEELLGVLDRAPAIVEPEALAQARAALVRWYETMRAVSSQLVAGAVGEAVLGDIERMQAEQRRAETLLEGAIAFDRGRLADAFERVRAQQRTTAGLRMASRVGLLALVTLLVVGLSRRVARSVEVLVAGLGRFGGGDFAEPLRVPGRDELSDLAESANLMAERLRISSDGLRRKQAELARSNAELEAFSYSVSHDLRTPLRSIDGFSQALLEDCADVLPPEGKGHLHRVRTAAQRMGELIDDLLQLSRVSRGEMRVAPVDLSEIAHGVAEDLRRSQPARKVEISIQEKVVAGGDARLLRIVLENLLGNAWKFSSNSPEPRVRFGERTIEGEAVYFVEDNGAGFDPAYADRLFGPFQRLHTASEYPGSGIGLATVQRIINRHGGRVWADGEVGRGATFYFTTVPAGEPGKGESGNSTMNSEPPSGRA